MLLDHAAAVLLKPLLLFFEGGDGFLLKLALELDEVEAFDLGPEPVYLHAGGVAFLADLVGLAGPFFEAGLVILALLQEAFVALEGDRWKAGVVRGIAPHQLPLEDFLLRGLRAELSRQIHYLAEKEAEVPVLPATRPEPALLHEAPDPLR